MAGQDEAASRKVPERVAVSSGDSSVEKPVSGLDSDGLTLPPLPASNATSPHPAPNVNQAASAQPESVDSSDAMTMAGHRQFGSPGEGSSVFRSIGATIFSEGDVLGARYEITKLLGIGGMGAVYKARDMEVERTVGLKVIRPELSGNPAILARFKQELILARQITHKNIIRIYDLNDADGVKFITMEFVEGEDLRSILTRRGKLPPEEAVEIMHQICAGLHAAHSEGVIHRDLKPSNIMRDQSGRVVIMDFGLARTVQGDGMTQTGMMIGTMEYMSPEQAHGLELDSTSDIYAVGLISYEMLTGKMPYAAESAVASLLRRSQQRAVPLSDIDKSISRVLSTIVGKCIEPEPRKRYQATHDLMVDLEALQPSVASTSSGGAVRRTRVGSPSLRTRIAGVPKLPTVYKWAAVAVAAVLISAGALYRWKQQRAKPEVSHAPVSVLVSDFSNQTGDTIFEGTLEPMFNVALEGANFINAYNRGRARRLAGKLPNPTDKLDEQTARLVAVGQGVSAIITGTLSNKGTGYSLSVKAIDAVTGKTLVTADVTAMNKDQVLLQVPKVAAPIRKALGDTTPESVQLVAAQGSFEASNLEAVHEYGVAMEQQFSGKMEDALRSFSRAAELDPNFARAYSGMAAAYGNMGRPADAEKYAKLAMQHIDRLSERERYRTRGTYYLNTGNWQKCVEEYGELVKKFPGDNIAHTNLANCYSQLRNWPRAVQEAQQDVDIHPNAAGLGNLALFSSYAGDFQSGESAALKLQQLNPKFEYGYLAQAFAQVGQGDRSKAIETYAKLAGLSSLGASMAASGLADLKMYEGRFSEAAKTLEQGAAADLAAGSKDRAADKFATLAYLEVLLGNKQAAGASVEKALANSQSVKIRFLAARIFIETGQDAKADKLASSLASEIQPEPQVYARILSGEAALQRGNTQEAIKAFTEANNLLDTWIGRFDLGRSYLEAGAFAEADSEFDRCIKRRGETLALFLDEAPTYGYFPPVYFYQGRVRQGLQSPGAVESFRTYLDLRGQSTEDRLVPEARKATQ